MDDCCAVCAEPLEWVAYGSCLHREVCSTCVARLRFVLHDRRCCICKTESPVVFVTKALGDFTRMMTDFSVFPQGPVEGKAGEFWYHDDTQAFFDDSEHYKMIKAMCRLSCSVCDRAAEEQGNEGSKRRHKFRGIEQLKGHLFHQHKLFMCNLCLEGRKVFICEQKLYTRSQLNQHIKTGDSEVDGSESERGGFMGHPMCEFCRNPFYGENELYMHMSQQHYTCHICQRQHPGDYEYFRNYEDLEMHFRQEHFLCENEACLVKKFVVFQTEAEMKRHNAIEHGGNMSRSKRNFALQIPTSFRYRRVEQEQRRGRGRGFRPEPSSNQLSLAIQASLETAMADGRIRGSSMSRAVTDHEETNQLDRVLHESLASNSGAQGPSRYPGTENQSFQTSQVLEESSFPPLVDRDLPEPSSRYAQALSQSTWSSSKLEEESFPPLPGASTSSKPNIVKGVESSTANNTLAARLRRRNKGPIISTAAACRHHDVGSSSSQVKSNPNQGFSSSTSTNIWPAINPARGNGFESPLPANSSWDSNNSNRIRHSSSAPNLADGQLPTQATSNTVHAVGASKYVAISNQPHPTVDDVQTANKFLVERIRAGLGMDEDKYVAFKSISGEYRQGLINTLEYLSYIEQFGLSHLVLELAWLCPDAHKRKELIDVYNSNLRNNSIQENGDNDVVSSRERKPKKGKGKGKERAETSSVDGALTDSFLDTVRKLQLSNKPQSGEVEVLSKDGYRSFKDKHQPSVVVGQANSSDNVSSDTSVNRDLQPAGASSDQTSMATSSKQRKKTSKFHRARLGDGSVAALLDVNRSNTSSEPEREAADHPSDGIPVRGVWRKGGVQKLFQ